MTMDGADRPIADEDTTTLGCAPSVPVARRSGEVLSARERDVLTLLGLGFTNKEAAIRLGLAPETVKCHIRRIFRKLAVGRRAHAVNKGRSLGLV